jgi:hypothetical protein
MSTKQHVFTNSLGVQAKSDAKNPNFPHKGELRVYIELSEKVIISSILFKQPANEK